MAMPVRTFSPQFSTAHTGALFFYTVGPRRLTDCIEIIHNHHGSIKTAGNLCASFDLYATSARAEISVFIGREPKQVQNVHTAIMLQLGVPWAPSSFHC